MKKLIYILLALWAFYGCQDDDSYFEISMPAENLSFTPIPGGSVMHYKLPSDGDILYIRVRYKDAFGKSMIPDPYRFLIIWKFILFGGVFALTIILQRSQKGWRTCFMSGKIP